MREWGIPFVVREAVPGLKVCNNLHRDLSVREVVERLPSKCHKRFWVPKREVSDTGAWR